jgi:hypothetical protein
MRSWPLAITFSVLMLAGCSSDDKKSTEPEPSNYLPQTSIANVIANLKTSYLEKNYEEYRKLLDPSFEYVFAPQDIGGPNNIPLSWGLADELLATQNMFHLEPNKDGYWAEAITLSYQSGAPVDTDLNPNWKKVVLSEIQLWLDSRNETSDVLIYMVSGDKAELYFVQTGETDDDSGLPIWKIVRWVDKPMAQSATATAQTTWGGIKGLWK